jgi:hypothetical protein
MDKVEIDGDTADRIVVCSLRETINYLRNDIKYLKKKKRLTECQKQEFADVVSALDHLEKTFDFYGGNLK